MINDCPAQIIRIAINNYEHAKVPPIRQVHFYESVLTASERCSKTNFARLFTASVKLHPHEPIFPRMQIHPCHIFVESKSRQFGGKFSRCFFSKWKKTEISAYFRFNPLLIFIFSAVLKENANQPAKFSGLILPEKWANLSQNVIVFGSCG